MMKLDVGVQQALAVDVLVIDRPMKENEIEARRVNCGMVAG